MRKKTKFAFLCTLLLGTIAISLTHKSGPIRANAALVEIDPWVKYEFKDAANPGKDTMNNHHLTTVGTVPTVAGGVITFNGANGLISTPDLSEELGTNPFTMVFDIKKPSVSGPGAWQEPIGFGWDDWSATFWHNLAIYPESWTLQFTTTPDGNPNQYNGTSLGDLKHDQFSRVIVREEPGAKITAYFNGVSKYSVNCPSDFSVANPTANFALGGNATWGALGRCFFTGSLANVAIYDFAFTDDQVTEYNTYGKIEQEVTVTVKSADVDLSSSIRVNSDDSDAVILASAPNKSTIQVVMTDNSTADATATWTNVLTEGTKKYLEGTLSGVVNINDVKAKALIAVVSDSVELKPVAKYEFLDTTNPGKDSMGNYHLTPSADGGGMPTLSLSDGAIQFDGSGGLVSNPDISEDLAALTIVYDIKLSPSPTGWQEPIGFGWDNWTATWWNVFMVGESSNMLRFTASGIDGNANPYWGKEIGNLSTTDYSRIVFKINPGEKMSVWKDGNKVFDYNCPSGYNVKNTNAYFALGANGTWGSTGRNYFRGFLKNVAIYDFAMTDQQVAVYNLTGQIKSNLVDKYLTIDPTPIFAGEVTSAALDDSMTTAEMLAKVNAATVKGTYGTEEHFFNVTWTGVRLESGKYYADGVYKVVGKSMPTASSSGVVTKELTVLNNVNAVQDFVDNYMYMTDPNYTGEGTGKCISDGTYAAAKTAYNALSEYQRGLFNTEAQFTDAKARLLAWAAANGDVINTSTYALEAAGLGRITNPTGGSVAVYTLLALALIAFTSAALVLHITKKRRAYN